MKAKRKKLMFAFGTRPEAIKMAPVIEEALGAKDCFETKVVLTGQHREMLDQVLLAFKIKADYDLKIMRPNQTLSGIAERCLNSIDKVLVKERPDLVLVQGDTSTAFIIALAAFYLRIPVAHVEAGLRTHNKYNPFPEEMNRRLISQVAEIHFPPTAWAFNLLAKEGITKETIFLTGNTVIDAFLEVASRKFIFEGKNKDLVPKGKKLIVVTTHRRESFGEPMQNVCKALRRVALERPHDIQIVLPVHKNPKVREVVFAELGDIRNVKLVEPMDYVPFVHLMKHAYLILTDSGGVQEEAPSLGKPVLVVRDNTERPEAVKAGTVKLVGTKEVRVFKELSLLLDDQAAYQKMSKAVNPYGDGRASKRMIAFLKYWFGFENKKPEAFISA
ncbi:MAG: UDP-N-acetylglucosamine 2-epimerase (non-hydrolyzing) [Candidatus Saganbacteria bacterium]|nr:UDP-N-acetylglucosamine 2-epimerase (non-hydrolyzing) [Candidatus Saganbacteria bacterium]